MNLLATKGVPPLVQKMFPSADDTARKLLSLRYYYHNGPSLKVVPAATTELPAALLKMASYLTHYSNMLNEMNMSKITNKVRDLGAAKIIEN